MCMERITSRNNQIVKDTRKLITSSRYRAEQERFVLEGARLCFDVLNSVYQPSVVLITDKAYEKYADRADELIKRSASSYFISEEVAAKLGDTDSPQGIFAVCMMSSSSHSFGNKLIALDNVQDPANIGAVIRTAEALGIDGIITYRCCDIYNPKVLRATMGGVLRMKPMDTDNLEELLLTLKATHKIYSTVPDSSAQDITAVNFNKPAVCVIGNEANGVEKNIKAISDALITIRMNGNAESLNAGVAAAITMWEMVRE